MEHWIIGFLKRITPLLHHSTTPVSTTLERLFASARSGTFSQSVQYWTETAAESAYAKFKVAGAKPVDGVNVGSARSWSEAIERSIQLLLSKGT